MHGHTVLLVEDEHEIREMLSFALGREGLNVIESATAEQALERLGGPLPDIVIIDWMLPGMDGVELARRLRRDELTRDLPLIMLTARGEEADKLQSFDMGIDDYITKPFSTRELLARMRALLRRTQSGDGQTLTHGPLTLDLASHRLRINEQNVHIGPTEFRLLESDAPPPTVAYSREQLLDRVWGRNVYVEERTVDVHVLRLRKVLQPYGCDHFIETVRGVGYRFAPES